MHKTVNDIMQKKGNQKISVVTSYDYTMATLCDQVDILLVGDSAGMVMLGYENTCPVTMDEMIMFTKAVANGRQNALIIADLPNKSYENENTKQRELLLYVLDCSNDRFYSTTSINSSCIS